MDWGRIHIFELLVSEFRAARIPWCYFHYLVTGGECKILAQPYPSGC